MGWVWSTRVEMHVMSSIAWEAFDQHMFKYILIPRWDEMCLANTCSDAFFAQVAWDGFG
jgi:hypothetical protein